MSAISEKIKKVDSALQGEESDLYRAAMKAMEKGPQYKSNEEALVAVTAQLAQLAQKMDHSVPELLHLAETSREFKEEYLEARALRGQIYCLKKT